MAILNYAGHWIGTISGTNQGGFSLEVRQLGDKVTGVAKLSEPAFGQYEYSIEGTVTDVLVVHMIPGHKSGNFRLGKVVATCSMTADGHLSGRWRSEVGTEGVLSGTRAEEKLSAQTLPKSNSVFLVHGHDEGAKHAVARFLEQLQITPVILQEQINRGMTVIEKFEEFASRAGFAVVLMTPDDFGYAVGNEGAKKYRPRQNVVLELGFFVSKLGREKTLVLTKGDVEMPSDVMGLVYEPMDRTDGWKIRLARELKAAGFKIDMNQVIS